MSAILPSIKFTPDPGLAKHFMLHQVHWIEAEDAIHAQHKQAFALAEKSVRIGWTYADAFKNVRKRLRFKNRHYLFATKDYPSALEYVRIAYSYAELFDFTRSIVSHGEESLPVPRLDARGRSTGFTEHIKVGVIQFDTGSRIIAFSANPQAMAVYGGDVGLDEFARHPNAELLWETAQGRITWGFDLAIWSAHCGDDTLFYQFAQQARAALAPSPHEERAGVRSHPLSPASASPSPPEEERAGERRQPMNPCSANAIAESATASNTPHSALRTPHSALTSPPSRSIDSQPSTISSPWNLYYRVTLPDAIELGLLDVINRERGTHFTPQQFIADCKARCGHDHIYQQTYLCNPVPGGAAIVDWPTIERCRCDYTIERVHLEAGDVLELFGQFLPHRADDRETQIHKFLHSSFPRLFQQVALSHPMGEGSGVRAPHSALRTPHSAFRLGFDVAASGQGDLAVIYIDEAHGPQLSLRALLTCRTEDWHFLETTLFCFLRELPSVQAAGDETGLGRQICWKAAQLFGTRFTPVNFTAKKHDLGFALMSQLSVAEKRFPRSEQDVAADYFALRKSCVGKKWVFTEGRNSYNPASHCDIAWAGALATEAHARKKSLAYAYAG